MRLKARALLQLFAGVALALHAPAVSGQVSPGTTDSGLRLLADAGLGPLELSQPGMPASATSREAAASKSYLIPALEIPAFILLLNGYDRLAYPDEMSDGNKTYDTSLSTFWDQAVHGTWVVDQNGFAVNQFGHPYQGSIYHGFARSAGLNYWESLLYSNVGSFLWETGGETSNPSINDQSASGTGGSFFGEALFRMASLVLEGDGSKPGFWHELGATILSPSTRINRLAFGDRFKSVFPSRDPATFWRLRLGVSQNSDLKDENGESVINRNEVTADFSMGYGLPGKPGYRYTRAFDYFHFEFSSLLNTENPFDNVMIRGLLLGKDYTAGSAYRPHPSRSAPPISGGSRARWRYRARSSAGSVTPRPAMSPRWINATTTTASLRRGSSGCV